MTKLEPGIMMGFANHQLTLTLIDEQFVEEELKAFRRNACTLYYVSKGIVDLFLINISDSLETSDVPFCVADWQEEKDFLLLLEEKENLELRLSYVDTTGNEVAARTGTLDTTMSQCIREGFKAQLMREFDEEVYEASLAKIQMKYEPFELEEEAIASCRL